MNKKFRIFFFLISLTFFFCDNPFTTREAEEPEQTETSWTQPLSAETVLFNFKNSLLEKNVENYVRCMKIDETSSSGFIFRPEAGTALNYPEVFNEWNIESERRYINQLFSIVPEDSVIQLELVDINEDIFLSDSAWVVRNYTFAARHTIPGYPTMTKGRIELGLSKTDRGLWHISFWEDRRTEDTPVWSVFKAIF